MALIAAFGLGRLSATPGEPQPVLTWHTPAQLATVQNSDPRELLPLPIPGDPDEQGQEMPGQEGQDECPVYFFQDGQFFELRPGESGPPGPFGQGTPELFPLDPVPRDGPPTPPTPPDPPEPPTPFFRNPGVAQGPAPTPQQVAFVPTRSSDPGSMLTGSTFRLRGR